MILLSIIVLSTSIANSEEIKWADGPDKIVFNGKEYCMSPTAFETFLKMGVALKYEKEKCLVLIDNTTKMKDAELEFAKKQAIITIGQLSKENDVLKDQIGKDREIALKELDKYRNPPIYRKNSFWFCVGATVATIVAILLAN